MHQCFLFGNHAFVDEVACNFDCGGSRTLAVTGLQHVKFTLFDGKFHVLHVSVVMFKCIANLEELFVHVGQYFCHFGNGHRGANACNNVFALCVHKKFAHQALFACCGVTCECNTCSAIVAHVTKRHHLHVYSGTPTVRNVVVHAVHVCTGVVPRTEHCFNSGKQLFFGVRGEILADLFFVFRFEFVCKFFEVVGGEFYVVGYALLLFHFVDEHFKVLLAYFHNYVGEHLNESSVAVPSPTGIVGFLCKNFHNFFVKTKVQNCVHHAGHGCTCAGTNGNKQRIFRVAELFAGDFFHFGNGNHNLRLDFVVDFSAVFVVLRAGFCGDGETLGNGQTDVCHFCKVGAFATQQFTHFCIAFAKQIGVFFSHCFIPPE